MLTEENKQALIAKISKLSDSQLEAVERYVSELDKAKKGASETEKKYLIFQCAEQLFGINISQVVQIIQVPRITPLPNFVPYIKGVISIREYIVPIIDLRLRLGKPEIEYNSQTCILIVAIENGTFGLIVDSVCDVEMIRNDEIYDPPKQGDAESTCLTGIAQKDSVILLLDVKSLMAADELESINNISEEMNIK